MKDVTYDHVNPLLEVIKIKKIKEDEQTMDINEHFKNMKIKAKEKYRELK